MRLRPQIRRTPVSRLPRVATLLIFIRLGRICCLPTLRFTLAEPQYVNAPQINQLIQADKLPLSLEQSIELALQNNPDIAVQRYNSWLAETDILRTKGGAAQRGVAGVATTATAFADVPTLSYDPTVTLLTSIDSRLIPSNNPLTSGVGTSSTTVGSLDTHTDRGQLYATTKRFIRARVFR